MLVQGFVRTTCESTSSSQLTQPGHCVTPVAHQLAFLACPSNGLTHLFEDTAVSQLHALLPAGDLLDWHTCNVVLSLQMFIAVMQVQMWSWTVPNIRIYLQQMLTPWALSFGSKYRLHAQQNNGALSKRYFICGVCIS